MAQIDPLTGLPTSNTPQAIPASSLSQQAAIQMPQFTPTPVDQNIVPTVASQMMSLADANAQTQAQENKTNAVGQDYLGIMSQLSGRTADAQAANEAAGVNAETANFNKYNQQITDYNAQASALSKEAEAAKQNAISQGRQFGAVSSFVASQQNEIERNRAVKALEISANADIASAAATGSQLRLNAAKDKAQQIVDLKYKPLEEQLAIKKQQYELNKDVLSQIDKKRTEALTAALRKEEVALAEKKANEKAVSAMLVNASSQGVPSNIYEKAKAIQARGGSEAEVAAALGVYSGDYLSTQIKKAQLAKLGLENSKAYNDLYSKPESELKQLSYEENSKFNATPEAKGIKDATNYARAVSDYKSAINKYGTGELFGAGSGVLGQAYSALVGATKDYYTLGTLDNGVQKLIDLGIPEPGLLGSKRARVGALDEAIRSANAKIKTNSNQLLNTSYKNTAELKQLLDGANEVLLSQIPNEDLLAQIPGSNQSGTNMSTVNFFNK